MVWFEVCRTGWGRHGRNRNTHHFPAMVGRIGPARTINHYSRRAKAATARPWAPFKACCAHLPPTSRLRHHPAHPHHLRQTPRQSATASIPPARQRATTVTSGQDRQLIQTVIAPLPTIAEPSIRYRLSRLLPIYHHRRCRKNSLSTFGLIIPTGRNHRQLS